MIDNGDAVRDALGFVHVVGGEKDGGLLRLIEMFDVGPKQVAALRIEAQRRLIEKEIRGVCKKPRAISSLRFMPPEKVFT